MRVDGNKTAPAVLGPLCPVQTFLDLRGHKWSCPDSSAHVSATDRTSPNPSSFPNSVSVEDAAFVSHK